MAGFVTSDGLHLHVEQAGAGPAIVCLAGLTRNSRDFDAVAPHLAGYRMVRMDYRGRGQSDWDPDPVAGYSVAREAQDVIEMMDHLGLSSATVLGTSRGGLIAMVLAATQPRRLNGVILNDVGPEVSASGIARIMDYVGRAPDWPDLQSAARGLQAAMAAGFPDVPLGVWHRQVAAQYHEVDETTLDLRYDPALRQALLEQAAATPTPDLWPLFDALAPLPCAVIRGANSDILTAQTLEQMQARNPDLRAVTIPNRAHVPFLDEPAAVALIHTILDIAQ